MNLGPGQNQSPSSRHFILEGRVLAFKKTQVHSPGEAS